MKKGMFMVLIIISFMASKVYADSSTNYNVNTSTSKESCTDWMWQPDTGCYWKTCVDNNGKQYCLECCKKKGETCVAKKVKCQ